MSTPLVFQSPYLYVMGAACIWLALPELRVFKQALSRHGAGREDAGSAGMIVLSWPASLVMAIYLAYAAPQAALAGVPILHFWTGLALMLSGGVLRRASMHCLGDYFTGFVETRVGHELISTGPYRWLLHPAYTGAWLEMTGFGVALGSTLGLILLAVVGWLVYAYRARIEEKALFACLGPAYQQFASRRHRFIPYIY
jgi:protein-S-isoprenylcysteine O-methyltransferase